MFHNFITWLVPQFSTHMGKLCLLDSVGSERDLATSQWTLRYLKGANINHSLLTISSFINALAEGKRNIPYKHSKLTLLLKM